MFQAEANPARKACNRAVGQLTTSQVDYGRWRVQDALVDGRPLREDGYCCAEAGQAGTYKKRVSISMIIGCQGATKRSLPPISRLP